MKRRPMLFFFWTDVEMQFMLRHSTCYYFSPSLAYFVDCWVCGAMDQPEEEPIIR